MSDNDKDESRMTALTRLAAGQDRLEKQQDRLENHMITLTKMLTEDRITAKARFRQAGQTDRAIGAGTGDAGAALAAGYFYEGHRRAGSIGIISRHIEQSFLRGRTA